MTTHQRRATVYYQGVRAGTLREQAGAYSFTYDRDYVSGLLPAVSLTLPKTFAVYEQPTLFAFFVSLLAEGDLAMEQCRRLQIDEHDFFGRLLATAGGDVIGCVTVCEQGAADV